MFWDRITKTAVLSDETNNASPVTVQTTMLSDGTNNNDAAHNIEDMLIEKRHIIGERFLLSDLDFWTRRAYNTVGNADQELYSDERRMTMLSEPSRLADQILEEMHVRYLKDGLKVSEVVDLSDDDADEVVTGRGPHTDLVDHDPLSDDCDDNGHDDTDDRFWDVGQDREISDGDEF